VTDDLTVTGGALYVGELAELRVDGDLTLKHGASMKVFGGSASEHNRNNYGAKVDVSGRLQVETGAWIYPYSHSTNGSHILFKAATLVIEEGGGIDADGRGYCRGYGPGVPTDGYNTGGGGYGGRGGDGDRYVGGLSYGSLAEPFEAGSGSGNYLNNGGHGGGSVHLDIAESAVINGTVSACGVSSGGSHSGGGSGGAINIECHSFGGGSQGFIRVDGGGGSNAGAAKTGSGGGGRIAVHYNTILPLAAVRFSANHGLTGPYLYNYSVPSDVVAPTLGTVWFPDGSLWSRALESWGGIADSINGNLYFGDGGTVCTITNLSLLRNSNLMVGAGQEWSLTTDITIQTSRLTVAESAKLYCKGDMVLGDYSELIAWSGPTNGISGEIYGSLVEVDGEMLISSNAWVYPFANSTNGAAPFFEVGKLMVKHGGGINADGCGFARGAGPGCGVSGYNAGGAGYGGDGGAGQRFGRGYAYGSALRPALPGSGGGIYSSGRGHGGGLIWIKARQEILLDGLLTACGGSTRTTRGGGGSGGGIYLVAPKIAGGQTAIFRCDGGQGTAGASGGGGGGRIAVWFGVEYSPDISDKRVIISELPLENYQGVANVAGGGGFEEGEEGTMRFVRVLPAPGTVLMLR